MLTNLITIAIPVFERTEFFYYSIQSALGQTTKCPIIVIDNCSSHSFFQEYIHKLGDSRISYFKNDSNIGLVRNWNRCIELCSTEWLTILHDDDILHPQFIERILSAIIVDQNLGMIAGGSIVGQNIPDSFFQNIDRALKLKYRKPSLFMYKNISPFPGVAIKKHLAVKVGYFNPDEYPLADLPFWYRISQVAPTAILDDTLAFYRVSPQQESNNVIESLLEKTWEFRNLVSIENKKNSLLDKLSLQWGMSELVKYYKNTYPDAFNFQKFESYFNPLARNRVYRKIMRWVVEKNSSL